MAKVRKVDFSPDEFISGVVGLTMEEGHTYWFLCALIYSSGDWIAPDDDRWRGIKADPRTVQAALRSLAKKGKIEVREDGKMMVRRCRSELEKASIRIQEASENGAKGGRPAKGSEKKQGDTKPDPLFPEKLSPSHTTITITHQEREGFFQRFMEAYPSRGSAPHPVDPARKAFEGALADGADPETLVALAPTACPAEHRGTRFVPSPAKWLTGGSWRGVPMPAAPAPPKPPEGCAGWRLAVWRAIGDKPYRSFVAVAEEKPSGATMVLNYPKAFPRDRARDHHGDAIAKAIRAAMPEIRDVKFIIQQREAK